MSDFFHKLSIKPSALPCAASFVLAAIFVQSESIAADFYNGRTVYTSFCQDCHGATGRGEMPGTPNFSMGRTLMQPDLSLYTQIRDGKNAMPGFRGVLSENDILDVITYIRTFY